jgi:hypothetical protein
MIKSKHLFALLYLLFSTLSGCALFQPSPHTQMITNIHQHIYPRPTSQLKADLVKAMPTLYSVNGPIIILNTDPYKNEKISYSASMDVTTEWEKGFTYAGKFYQTQEVSFDIEDLLSLDDSKYWKKKIHEMFINKPFHVVKDTPDEFIIVRGAEVLHGKTVPGGSTLQVYALMDFDRGPIRLALDLDLTTKRTFKWWEFIRLEQDPIKFETSYPRFARPAPMRALAALYLLDPDTAAKMEQTARERTL